MGAINTLLIHEILNKENLISIVIVNRTHTLNKATPFYLLEYVTHRSEKSRFVKKKKSPEKTLCC